MKLVKRMRRIRKLYHQECIITNHCQVCQFEIGEKKISIRHIYPSVSLEYATNEYEAWTSLVLELVERSQKVDILHLDIRMSKAILSIDENEPTIEIFRDDIIVSVLMYIYNKKIRLESTFHYYTDIFSAKIIADDILMEWKWLFDAMGEHIDVIECELPLQVMKTTDMYVNATVTDKLFKWIERYSEKLNINLLNKMKKIEYELPIDGTLQGQKNEYSYSCFIDNRIKKIIASLGFDKRTKYYGNSFDQCKIRDGIVAFYVENDQIIEYDLPEASIIVYFAELEMGKVKKIFNSVVNVSILRFLSSSYEIITINGNNWLKLIRNI